MGGLISRRWEMACLMLSGLVIVYTLRVNMSVAAQKMKTELDWTESQKGYILSSFYWGYAIGQVPASIIAQHYGAKWLFGLSIAIPAFLTIMVPMACHHSFGMALFIRVLIGFFESANFPAIYHFFPIWVPNSEKTFMIPFIVCGIYLGEIVGFSFSGVLADSEIYINGEFYGGWPSIFYVFGLAGLLWFPLWIMAAYESPAVHPYITEEELQFMRTATSFGKVTHGANDSEESEDIELSPIHPTDTDYHSTKTSKVRKGTKGGKDGYMGISNHSTHSGSVYQTVDLEQDPTSPPSVPTDTLDTTYSTHTTHTVLSPYHPHLHSSTASTSDAPLAAPAQRTLLTRAQEEEESIRVRIELAKHTPWRQFVTHPTALCLLVANFQYGWMNFTLMSEMPSFFTDVLGFDLRSAGILCTLPYIALFFSAILFGKFFEYLEHQRGWHVTNVRRAAQFSAYFCSGIGLILCGYIHNKMGAYAAMIMTLVFFGSNQSGLGCVWTDIAPNYSSSLNSLGNTIGAIAGILGPIVVAWCTETWPEHGEGWRVAFFFTFFLSCASLVLWFAVVKAEIMPALNNPRSD